MALRLLEPVEMDILFLHPHGRAVLGVESFQVTLVKRKTVHVCNVNDAVHLLEL